MLDRTIAKRLMTDDRRIVITGAGGWLGLATIDSLMHALGATFSERVVCVGSSARLLALQDGRTVPQIALDDVRALPRRPTWVLHFAFLTKDRAEAMSEADYRAANARIGETLLASLDPLGAEGIFVASSGAACHARDEASSPAMRLYGQLKEEDEVRFAAWAEDTRHRAVIARIFNVTGPYINKHQAYALASFILDGLAGRPIVVRAPRRVVRAYVPISEVISVALAELGSVEIGTCRFDTGGQPLELGDVAALVAAQFPGVEVERAAIVQARDDIYHGDVRAYAALLARHGVEPQTLAAQIAKTIDYLRRHQ